MTPTKIRLFLGEQDGKTYELPDDAAWLYCPDPFDVDNPPPLIWVLPVLSERAVTRLHGREPKGMRTRLATCAYRFADDYTDIDGEVLELHYERDVSADEKRFADL